jgi:hypothetical protein
MRAALKVGAAVQAAVERFVTVGETIADENVDIQPEMYDACHEARAAGKNIGNLVRNRYLYQELWLSSKCAFLCCDILLGCSLTLLACASICCCFKVFVRIEARSITKLDFLISICFPTCFLVDL